MSESEGSGPIPHQTEDLFEITAGPRGTRTLESPQITADELIKAANDASNQARTMWLAFLAVLAYLIVTIAGTTHRDLLLNNPVTLPFLNVDIPLFSFFIYGPAVVLALHVGLLIQHAMLSYKLFRLTEFLDDGGWHRPGPDIRRSKLSPYIVAQLIAGPERGPLLGVMMRFLTWISLVALPVLVLLYFQIAFLPYHDVAATYWQRTAIIFDLLALFALWPYIRPASPGEGQRRPIHDLSNEWPWRISVLGFGLGTMGVLVVLSLSWLVATIPDACLLGSKGPKSNSRGFLCLDRMTARLEPWTVEITSGKTKRDVFWPTAALFEGKSDPVTGRPTSLWSRNIVLTDADLVPEKDFKHGEVSLALRGRDLRYAVLDRSDLHRADFTGVDLRGASLKQTRLSGAHFCVPLKVAPRRCSLIAGADLREANLGGVDFWGADLRGAELAFVRLEGADFRNANLEGANLAFAALNGADLSLADLTAAKLSYAKLDEANLDEAELLVADLDGASLQGAHAGKAVLEGANLSSADLTGVVLHKALLRGADLSDAKLEASDLRQADLRGSNLNNARLAGSDLRFAMLWGASNPGSRGFLELADLRGVSFSALNASDREALVGTLDGISDKHVRARLSAKLKQSGLIEGKPDWQARDFWEEAVKRLSERELSDFQTRFNAFWAKLACGDKTVAASIARRIETNGFIADSHALARLLTRPDCGGAVQLARAQRKALCRAAAWSAADRPQSFCR